MKTALSNAAPSFVMVLFSHEWWALARPCKPVNRTRLSYFCKFIIQEWSFFLNYPKLNWLKVKGKVYGCIYIHMCECVHACIVTQHTHTYIFKIFNLQINRIKCNFLWTRLLWIACKRYSLCNLWLDADTDVSVVELAWVPWDWHNLSLAWGSSKGDCYEKGTDAQATRISEEPGKTRRIQGGWGWQSLPFLSGELAWFCWGFCLQACQATKLSTSHEKGTWQDQEAQSGLF